MYFTLMSQLKIMAKWHKKITHASTFWNNVNSLTYRTKAMLYFTNLNPFLTCWPNTKNSQDFFKAFCPYFCGMSFQLPYSTYS